MLMTNLQILDLCPNTPMLIQQIAILLVKSFKEHYPRAWPTIEDALEEVQASFGIERISRVAIDENERVLGWIGAIEHYQGNVWEIHPLVVHQAYQRRGIGRMLIKDLEKTTLKRGGLTLWVGTDDEDNQTTLSDVNLYENPWEQIDEIRNLKNHPYEFYQKCGFVIVGVMPDANGIGKPDIYMAKSLRL